MVKFLDFYIKDKLEKAMAPHSSTLAWKIPWTEEPGRLQSMGFKELGTTESQGWRSLVGCHLRGRTELDTTEAI